METIHHSEINIEGLYDQGEGIYDYQNDTFPWMTTTKKQYVDILQHIDSVIHDGNGWKMYMWCDVSSFEYWKKRREDNYIQITIRFEKEEILKSEIITIAQALISMISEAKAIQYKALNPVFC